MQIVEPIIAFTRWFSWSTADQLDEYRRPGVYILARFEQPPSGSADPLAQEVIYIGETCGQTLGMRLNQFDRSAFLQRSGHSGGWTYGATFFDGHNQLYFAMFAVADLPAGFAAYFIRHVERSLLWEYVKLWGKPPCCNSK